MVVHIHIVHLSSICLYVVALVMQHFAHREMDLESVVPKFILIFIIIRFILNRSYDAMGGDYENSVLAFFSLNLPAITKAQLVVVVTSH